MQKHKLGSNQEVSAIGLGCMGMSANYGTAPDRHLEENLGAADLELTADDLREIEDAVSQITVQGARYPEDMDRLTGR